MTRKEEKVIQLKNNERITVGDEEAVLIINGEVIHLDSFVLSGLDKNEERIVLMYNCSVDESIVYDKILNVSIDQKIIQKLTE